MRYMLNIIPQADEYLKFLHDEGIIEVLNYSAGRNSRMYRLRDEGRTEFRTITDAKIIRRIERYRKNGLMRNSKKYPFLNQWIYKVEIDTVGALATIESKYASGVRGGNENAEGRRSFSLAAISKIQAQEIYIKVNKTNGRLDSNITSLPSELLPHVTVEGKHLVEIDIKNSQLFFAACLVDVTPEVERVIDKFLGKSYTMLVKSLHISDCEDVRLFRSLTTEGSFYHYMWLRLKENGICFDNRRQLKESLFIIFFGKCNAYKYNKVARVFRAIFPNVQRLFDAIKKDDYTRLAVLLQRLESYCILERVARCVAEELPRLPLLTRHDSCLPAIIMTEADRVRDVEKIIKSTIKTVTGQIPQTRIK